MDEQYNIWRKLFFAFLKKNDIYEKWIHNLLNGHPMDDIKWWNCFNKKLYGNNCGRAIICAFCWCETKEGFDFWSELNHKWSDYRIETMKTGFYD